MLKGGLSTFNTGIRRVSNTHRNGFMDDLPTLPPFYVHFENCLVVLRIYSLLFFFLNSRLGLDYVDLYLIHSPYGGDNVATYRQMMEFQKQGLIKYDFS